MSWLENFSKAKYIETHLDKRNFLEDMAKNNWLFNFLFSKNFFFLILSVFHYLNISDDARMTQAGFDLKRTDMRVLDVALKYAYSSPHFI